MFVQSRYPAVPYLRFNGEVPEVPFPGEEHGCGCRADASEVAVAVAASGLVECGPCGKADVSPDHPHVSWLGALLAKSAVCGCSSPSKAKTSGHGSVGRVGADVSGANAGSPGAAGVTSSASAGAPKRDRRGRFVKAGG